MPELSVLIPARNEEWLARTIQDVLEHSGADTEVIAVIDGEHRGDAPQPHPRLKLIMLSEPIGQRAATNLAARESKAKYVMKLDAHCSLEPGFDAKCIAALDGHPDWTLIPQQHNLWVFSWKCLTCGKMNYMGPRPTQCQPVKDNGRALQGHTCPGKEFERVMVWKPRPGTHTDFWRFDHTMHFQYQDGWNGKRAEGPGELYDTMSCIGACWMLDRERYWKLGGMDEKHGSWGQMGTELACKTWLSGGRMVTHRGTWFAHMFRTRQSEGFGFPYENKGGARIRAQEYSRDLWMNDKWPGQVLPLAWLVNKFKPLYGHYHDEEHGRRYVFHSWHDDVPECRAALQHIRESEKRFYKTHERLDKRAVYA